MRAICLALPEVTERLSHGAPTWFVRDKSSATASVISAAQPQDRETPAPPCP
jgi:hypothetical protein